MFQDHENLVKSIDASPSFLILSSWKNTIIYYFLFRVCVSKILSYILKFHSYLYNRSLSHDSPKCPILKTQNYGASNIIDHVSLPSQYKDIHIFASPFIKSMHRCCIKIPFILIFYNLKSFSLENFSMLNLVVMCSNLVLLDFLLLVPIHDVNWENIKFMIKLKRKY